jgi:hypothetical protein
LLRDEIGDLDWRMVLERQKRFADNKHTVADTIAASWANLAPAPLPDQDCKIIPLFPCYREVTHYDSHS